VHVSTPGDGLSVGLIASLLRRLLPEAVPVHTRLLRRSNVRRLLSEAVSNDSVLSWLHRLRLLLPQALARFVPAFGGRLFHMLWIMLQLRCAGAIRTAFSGFSIPVAIAARR
jgi:hypothetical protein